MPIYMDRHYVVGATRHALANAHEKDLEKQDQYGVHFLTYWFDETRCTAFCLVDAPDIDSIPSEPMTRRTAMCHTRSSRSILQSSRRFSDG